MQYEEASSWRNTEKFQPIFKQVSVLISVLVWSYRHFNFMLIIRPLFLDMLGLKQIDNGKRCIRAACTHLLQNEAEDIRF